MQFPKFQDFLATLSPEMITGIMEDAKLKCESLTSAGTGEQIGAISWTISLELLALYHVWLEESLQNL